MKRKLLQTGLIMLGLCIPAYLFAAEYYFFIRFTDKNNTPYSLQEPRDYLSERALIRRSAFQIDPDSTDLPVDPAYIAKIQSQGVCVHSASKWLNGVTVVTTDSTLIHPIRQLPFVRHVQFTGLRTVPTQLPSRLKYSFDAASYGSALAQINQLKGTVVHQQGFRGRGILIAVLDAGFRNVDTNPGFDSLRLSKRLTGSMSVIDPSTDVYREDSHGALVLSAMAGNLPGKYTGTAPDASYYLLQTEYVPTEYLVETDFWVRGAEIADSVGADIINSSLGYTDFDDPGMNFSYADMNGKVARSSIAAELAAKKGIIVCNSAGNSGTLAWKFLSSPADAHSVISVGSVDLAGNSSSFSSYGPSSDDRIKPEVSANGYRTALIDTGGAVVNGNGTSFSSPLIAGMAACYLQQLREQNTRFTVDQFISALLRSSSLYATPHPQAGYGIPDFSAVTGLISGNRIAQQSQPFSIIPEPGSSQLTIRFLYPTAKATLTLTDIAGRVIFRSGITEGMQELAPELPGAGFYMVQITIADQHYVQKVRVY